MHIALRFALLFCPRGYRVHYGHAITNDVTLRGLNVWITAIDLAYNGTAMRFETLWRDVVFGLRALAKARLFALICVITIALAIGANVAAGSILRGMLLEPLPYAHPDRLVFIGRTFRGEKSTDVDYPDMQDIARRSKTLSTVAVAASAYGTMTNPGKPRALVGWSVGGAYFGMLGVKSELGRLLSNRDQGTRNIVISDEFWRKTLGGTPSVLGRRLAIDGHDYTIVGVAPPHFLNPGPGFMGVSDYWVAIDPSNRYSTGWRGFEEFAAIARLKDGVSISAASADVSRVAAQLARQYPRFDRGRGAYLVSMNDAMFVMFRTMLLVVYAAALIVLLIAGVNVVNLMLTRAAARSDEFAVRAAVGATRVRLAMQLAVETALLTAAGGALGIALGWLALRWCDRAVNALFEGFFGGAAGAALPNWNRVHIDGPVLLYTLVLAFVFTIATGFLPALLQGRSIATKRAVRRQKVLVVCEIVLAFMLVALAGLLVRSFIVMESAPSGYAENNVYAISVGTLPYYRYKSAPAILDFEHRAIDRLRAIPGTEGVAAALVAGLGSSSGTNYSLTQPANAKTSGLATFVALNTVSPDFFRTLEIPLLRGRLFDDSDAPKSQPVAIVSKNFAIREFGSVNAAIGKHVSVGDSSDGTFPLRTIVGVVGNVRHSLSRPPAAEVYAPATQIVFFNEFVVRTSGHDVAFGGEVRRALEQSDPLLAPAQIMPLSALRALDGAPTRLAATVLGALAVVALLLALAGIYGVVSYSVERRTHEFGVRMAIGARKRDIVFSVLRETLLTTAGGVFVGAVLAAFAGEALSDALFQTSPQDPLTFAAAIVLLLVCASLAAAVPAVRATRVQPSTALRYE